MFELNQLRCFVAVAEELHFGRAAARLNMTQPPLSRQIQVLEHILGVTLFNRSSRSVLLTPTGKRFLPEARRLIQAAENAAELARRIHAGTSGTLKIAFTAATAYRFLPLFLTACRDAMPDVVLLLREMVTRSQVDGLLTGELDLGLLRPPITRPEFDSALVLTEPFLAAVNDDHPLAAGESVALSDFHNEPFLMYSSEDARYFHDMVVSLLWSANAEPQYVQQLTQIHSMLALVKAGLGLAIVPAAARTLHYHGVTLLPLRLKKEAHVELYGVWRRDNENPVLHPAIELLKSVRQLQDFS